MLDVKRELWTCHFKRNVTQTSQQAEYIKAPRQHVRVMCLRDTYMIDSH